MTKRGLAETIDRVDEVPVEPEHLVNSVRQKAEFEALVLKRAADAGQMDKEAVGLIRRFLREQLVQVLEVPLKVALDPLAKDSDRLEAFDKLAKYAIGPLMDKNLHISTERQGVIALPMLEATAPFESETTLETVPCEPSSTSPSTTALPSGKSTPTP